MTSRSFCITFFTKPVFVESPMIRYFVAGHEIAPTTGKEHWQSYIELNMPVRASAIKKIFNDKTIHIEKRMGTRDEARNYCLKDGKFEEFGIWNKCGQGNRSDLNNFVNCLKDGKKISDLMVEEPRIYCQYRNGLKDVAAKFLKDRSKEFRNVEIILLSGPTGCGKTRKAMEEASYKISGADLGKGWWQDYDEDEVICIDEYDNNLKCSDMLSILDGYQLRLNVKGSHTYAMWKKVYITTNLRYYEIHPLAKQAHKDAFWRRVTKIVDLWDDGSFYRNKPDDDIEGAPPVV